MAVQAPRDKQLAKINVVASRKDRFDSVFSFLEEGGAGVRADKAGAGLLKVWKLQLQQLHNLGPDVASAITAVFPSPLALKQVGELYLSRDGVSVGVCSY